MNSMNEKEWVIVIDDLIKRLKPHFSEVSLSNDKNTVIVGKYHPGHKSIAYIEFGRCTLSIRIFINVNKLGFTQGTIDKEVNVANPDYVNRIIDIIKEHVV